MFRSIYKKLCTTNRNTIGAQLSHCNDWWGDGSGDMLFVRSAWNKAWMEWAKEPIQPEEPKNEESAADYVNRISANAPVKSALTDCVKAITHQERNDYTLQVDFTDTDEGVEMAVSRTGSVWKSSVYTREQLRQLADAVNAYLAK